MIRLPVADTNLEITSDASGWTKINLVLSGELKYLGSEAGYIIKERLVKNLFNQKVAGSINGQDVSWVISLSEAHCTLYSAKNDDSWNLFWQGPDGVVFWEGVLTNEQYKVWKELLSKDA